MCGTVDNHILTEDVEVADDQLALLAFEMEILGQGTENGTLMHLIIITHARTVQDTDERKDDTVVANDNIILDIYEGIYFTIIADFRLWTDFGSWRNITCHKEKPLSYPPLEGGSRFRGAG